MIKEVGPWLHDPPYWLSLAAGQVPVTLGPPFLSNPWSNPVIEWIIHTTSLIIFSRQILEVMHENLRSVTHSLALHALRQTPNRVRLVIHREDDEIYETIEVELNYPLL